ncbi:MAG TPA: type II toxin-antitoxin system HicA family toxin [Anaerolineae bacterium]|nr:type II toxin-antitoxin system HicA family toxin [Anaerolineae bacterium]
MKYRELAKRLKDLGCVEDRQGKGSHQLWYNPATNKITSIPAWSGKDLKAGTVSGILKQLGISRKDFGPIK